MSRRFDLTITTYNFWDFWDKITATQRKKLTSSSQQKWLKFLTVKFGEFVVWSWELQWLRAEEGLEEWPAVGIGITFWEEAEAGQDGQAPVKERGEDTRDDDKGRGEDGLADDEVRREDEKFKVSENKMIEKERTEWSNFIQVDKGKSEVAI